MGTGRRAHQTIFTLGLYAILTAVLVGPPKARGDDRFFTMEEDVRLSPRMEAVMRDISSEYHRRTGQRLHVTSGTRTAEEQADAMYDKLRAGQPLTRLYRDYDAAEAIQVAYRSARRRGRMTCVNAMTRVIETQVRRGTFISRHLTESAADVRSRSMTRTQRRVFRGIVASHEDIELLEEGTPPHFHLQL